MYRQTIKHSLAVFGLLVAFAFMVLSTTMDLLVCHPSDEEKSTLFASCAYQMFRHTYSGPTPPRVIVDGNADQQLVRSNGVAVAVVLLPMTVATNADIGTTGAGGSSSSSSSASSPFALLAAELLLVGDNESSTTTAAPPSSSEVPTGDATTTSATSVPPTSDPTPTPPESSSAEETTSTTPSTPPTSASAETTTTPTTPPVTSEETTTAPTTAPPITAETTTSTTTTTVAPTAEPTTTTTAEATTTSLPPLPTTTAGPMSFVVIDESAFDLTCPALKVRFQMMAGITVISLFFVLIGIIHATCLAFGKQSVGFTLLVDEHRGSCGLHLTTVIIFCCLIGFIGSITVWATIVNIFWQDFDLAPIAVPADRRDPDGPTVLVARCMPYAMKDAPFSPMYSSGWAFAFVASFLFAGIGAAVVFTFNKGEGGSGADAEYQDLANQIKY